MAQIQSDIVFNNFPGSNSQVTAQLLNNHVNNARLVSGAIGDQVSTTPLATDSILIQRGAALNKATIQQVINLVPAPVVPAPVPIGAIIMWGTVTPPTGWLELNGQASPASLVPLYGSNVPDMRGYFPRGWANGSAVDPQSTRAILSTQAGALQQHAHNYTRTDGQTLLFTPGSNTISQIGGTSTVQTGAVITAPGEPTPGVSSFETRPVNRALMFIIKYQ